MKSIVSCFVPENSLRNAGRVYPGPEKTIKHSISSITLEIVVASAAPLACMQGAPSNPKIKIALNAMFSRTTQALIHALELT